VRRARISAAVFLSGLLTGEPAAALPAPTADGFLQSAAAAYRDGRLDDALKDMVKALEIDPENPTAKNYVWALVKRVRQEQEKGSLSPEEQARAVRLAALHLEERRRRSREVLERLKDTRSAGTRRPSDILAGLGGLESFLGHDFAAGVAEGQARAYFEEILGQLTKAIQGGAFVSRKDQLRAEGFLAYYQQDWAKTARLWRKALDEDPDDAVLKKDFHSLTALIEKSARAEKARELARQAEAYQKTAYWAQAEKTWKEVLALDPQFPAAAESATAARVAREKTALQSRLAAMTDEGLKLYQAGGYGEAAQKWLEVLRLDPTYEKARVWLRYAGDKLKQLDRSTETALSGRPAPLPRAVRAGEAAAPSSADKERGSALYKKGILLYSQDNVAGAIAAWKESLRYDPGMSLAQQAIRQAQAELAFQAPDAK
jgi:tetratricopeptide (TPR) repeat protein